MDFSKTAKNKFQINQQHFTATGTVGESAYDIRGHNMVKIAVEGVGGGNKINVYGRIKNQTNWTLIITINGTSDGALANTSFVDEIYFDCQTYSASGTPALIASGFWIWEDSTMITGSGAANQVTFWNGVSSLTGSDNLTWDGTTLKVLGRVGLGGASVAYAMIATAGSTTLTGADQSAFRAQHTINSAGTDGSSSFVSALSTANSAFTCAYVLGFYANDTIKGAASTITRQVHFYFDNPTVGGTGNAAIANNLSFTGNWFINSTLTSPSLISGDTTIRGAVANTARIFAVEHSDNSSNGSRAIIRAQGGGTSGGDPVFSWYVNGSTEFMAGIDVSDSRYWKLAGSGALGTSDFVTVSPAGIVTFPIGAILVGGATGALVPTGLNGGGSVAGNTLNIAASQSGAGTAANLIIQGGGSAGAGANLYMQDGNSDANYRGVHIQKSNNFLDFHNYDEATGSNQYQFASFSLGATGGTLTLSPKAAADVVALRLKAGTTTGTVRNYWQNSDNTRNFEIDADFTAAAEKLVIQSDLRLLGIITRDGDWTLGGNGLTPTHRINCQNQGTVGAAGGASALPATPSGYMVFKINGTTEYCVPYYPKS